MRGERWTVEQWAAMTAAEQDAVFEASVITDLSQVPEEYLAVVRREFEARVAERDVPNAS